MKEHVAFFWILCFMLSADAVINLVESASGETRTVLPAEKRVNGLFHSAIAIYLLLILLGVI